MMKFKMTKNEKNWVLYDVGNSAFIRLVSTILASFMGTTIVSFVSQMTGDVNKSVGMIAILFVIGIVIFRLTVKID